MLKVFRAGAIALTISTLLLPESVIAAKDLLRVPPGEQPILRSIQAEVSAEHIKRTVTKLVGFGTRHTLSETESDTRGIGAARRWIKSEFEQISAQCGGCLQVIEQKQTFSGHKRIPQPTEVVNIVAIQRGTLDPNRYVIMSGDIDSRVTDPLDATSDSPGANDNASGVAGVLEAARVLSQHKFAGSIVYAALSGEEQGLFGGKIMASIAKKEGWRVEAVINNDMIGNISGINGVINNATARVFSEGTRFVETAEEARKRRFTGGEVDSPSRNVARYIDKIADNYIPNLDVMMVYRLDRFGRGGHHRPFNEEGFPGVRIMETNEHYDRQHQDLRSENGRQFGDVLSGVDFAYNAKLTSLNAVTLASMAWAPPPPAETSISGAVRASTTLSWQRPQGKMADNLAGYRLYWRLTTEPTWTRSQYVGDVTEFELKNIVIDNYFFGVSSVSKDGFESPVVFPGPAGSFGGYQ
ncbi:M28 family peptidase [Thalassomonas viridans]|uniref:M28 family peptidase n=1 Tax=Thalassomonas viridans TaxID=137584 RepID=A0AAE9ZFF2_9GAMM|nr:M28 family peptidase [Thalassomonas viridans]WDE09308.1 M28 family peptidase [Thalassomonas viridans]